MNINGGAGDDTLSGGKYSDIISAGEGKDKLYGGAGHDVLFFGADDTAEGGAGRDAAYLTGDKAVTLDLAATGFEVAVGTKKNDVLNASGVREGVFLRGNDGDDVLTGSAHGDRIYGDDGDDTLTGGRGGDLLSGGKGEDVLKGEDGSDILVGGAGDDRLEGGSAEDVLAGGDGADVLIGGPATAGEAWSDLGVVKNGDFEAQRLGEDGSAEALTGWQRVGKHTGAWNPAAVRYSEGLVAHDDHVAYVNGGMHVSQQLALEFDREQTYRLSVDVLKRKDAYLEAASYKLTVLAGGVELGSKTGTLTGGDIRERHFVVIRPEDITDITTAPGAKLSIRLETTSGTQLNYDNVAFERLAKDDDVLDGGAGDDVLTGGYGADMFVLGENAGDDVITDFSKAQGDRLDLSGVSTIRDLADLKANHATQQGADLVISDGKGGKVTLNDVTNDALTEDNVIFTSSPAPDTQKLTIQNEGSAVQIAPTAFQAGKQDSGTAQLLSANSVKLSGNVWKSFLGDWKIDAGDKLRFKVDIAKAGEITGVMFTNGDTLAADHAFKIGGTDAFGIDASNYAKGGGVYEIDVSKHFTGDFDRIVLFGDDDANSQALTTWSDIEII